MTLLNDVKAALDPIDKHVYYGTAAEHDKSLPWDYIVFSRDVVRRKPNKSGNTYIVNVAIVREEFVPEDIDKLVSEAMEAIPGVRMVEGDHEFFYSVKPNTHHTVEMVVLKFTYSRKL